MAWRTKISLPFTTNLSAVKPSRDMNSMSEITVCIPPVYLVLFQCSTKPLGRSATLYYKKNSRFKVKMEKMHSILPVPITEIFPCRLFKL